MSTVAGRLGLQLSSTAKPPGYWDSVAHIELAIREFNEARGMPSAMPTGGELQKAGRSDLITVITNYGGFPVLAEQFSLTYTYTAKPNRYWSDFANVERELLAFIRTQGTEGVMPAANELGKARQSSLVLAIGKHGGVPAVAERLGLAYISKKMNGYWNDFTNVERELTAFISKQGKLGIMPTLEKLDQARQSVLVFAINKHSGVLALAQRLVLQLSYPNNTYVYPH